MITIAEVVWWISGENVLNTKDTDSKKCDFKAMAGTQQWIN